MRGTPPRHQEQPVVAWHALEIDEVFRRLESPPEGIDEATARQRLRERGPNTLGSGEGANLLRVLAHQVNNPLVWLLAAAAPLSIVVGHPVDAAVIAGVIVLNSLPGFLQEWRAEGALLVAARKAGVTADHGAAERLIDRCTHVLSEGGRVELDDVRRREVQETVAQFASQALRVMAGAFRDFSPDKDRLDAGDVEQGLTLARLWGMIDPPREESRQAVDDARTVAFTVLAAFQWFQALNARSQHHSVFTIGPFSNRGLLTGIAAAVLLQVIVVSTPIGGLLFGTTPLGLHGRPWRGQRRAGARG